MFELLNYFLSSFLGSFQFMEAHDENVELHREVKRLKSELKEVKEERDELKEALCEVDQDFADVVSGSDRGYEMRYD